MRCTVGIHPSGGRGVRVKAPPREWQLAVAGEIAPRERRGFIAFELDAGKTRKRRVVVREPLRVGDLRQADGHRLAAFHRLDSVLVEAFAHPQGKLSAHPGIQRETAVGTAPYRLRAALAIGQRDDGAGNGGAAGIDHLAVEPGGLQPGGRQAGRQQYAERRGNPAGTILFQLHGPALLVVIAALRFAIGARF
jgi:hypothetical protein